MNTRSTTTHALPRLDHESAALFIAAHSLPEPSYRSIPNFTTRDVLSAFITDFFVLAVVKRLHDDPGFDNQLLIDVLTACIACDDQSTTMFNSMTLLEHFHQTGQKRQTRPLSYSYMVSGLSHHNGPRGSTAMERLVEPAEIAGAAAVITFMETMDRDGLIKLSKLKHPESSDTSGMTITNGYLDRYLRANPQRLDAICTYLESHQINATKKSVQPLLAYLAGGGSAALVDGLI